jgi:alpha-1,2-mannosyltransferase
MLLIAVRGTLRHIAGWVLLLVMILSLGVLLGEVSTYPGAQFLLENARVLGVVAVCLTGAGGIAATANPAGGGAGNTRAWLRVATTAVAALAAFAVLPLPAGADPTFKAYTLADASNPRMGGSPRTVPAARSSPRSPTNSIHSQPAGR